MILPFFIKKNYNIMVTRVLLSWTHIPLDRIPCLFLTLALLHQWLIDCHVIDFISPLDTCRYHCLMPRRIIFLSKICCQIGVIRKLGVGREKKERQSIKRGWFFFFCGGELIFSHKVSGEREKSREGAAGREGKNQKNSKRKEEED